MVSSSSVPWYDRPARPFPALVWLKHRYPFTVSPLAFAWRIRYASGAPAVRRTRL